MTNLFPKLNDSLLKGTGQAPMADRLDILLSLAETIKRGLEKDTPLHLRFVCTHNARRSQFSQIICHALAKAYHLNITTSSAGTHKTQVHPTVVKVLDYLGFRSEKAANSPAEYLFYFAQDREPILAYSKTLEDAARNSQAFWAVMVCNQADVNCPIVPGASKRMVLSYVDPGDMDGTEKEFDAYLNTARTIAMEWNWMFNRITTL